MGQFTKKPVTIEAMQVPPASDAEARAALNGWLAERDRHEDTRWNGPDLIVRTIHGEEAVCRVGDWVIPEPQPGRFYPCKPDIFAATYEAASRAPDATGEPVITTGEADAALAYSPAPRVTLEGMKAKVASAEYFRSRTLTLCILTLTNGFTLVGKSACASPENYDRDLGQRYAYDDAFRQLWAFEGYLLRQRLHEAA